jgi:hypothetical protein
MTISVNIGKNDKELLIKDLCARLPYKVYAQVPDKYGGYTSAIESIDFDGFVKDFEGEQIEIENIKPYLFPLSSMTEEQRKELQELHFDYISDEIFIDTEFVYREDYVHLIDWLNKNHFDWRGLIPRGLAIDATNLNIY